MSMARAIAAALVVIAVLCACASSNAPEAAPRTSVGEELIARIDQFHDAIREGDKESCADVFVDDFVFTWSRNGQLYDRESILPNVVPTPDFTPLVDGEAFFTRFERAIREAERSVALRMYIFDNDDYAF